MKELLVRIVSGLVFILTVLGVSSCNENEIKPSTPQARPVKAVQLAQTKSLSGRSFPGKARASQEVDLSFNVNGSLVELPIKMGDKVKKGDLLAKLDQRDFIAKVKSAQAEELRDKQNYERAKQLVGKGHISKADFDLVESKLTVSRANLDVAQKALIDTEIKAPFAGQIAKVYVDNFQTVASKQMITRLLNIVQIEMVVQIPENVISLIPSVKDLSVKFDAFPGHSIPAKIKEVSNEASPDTRTYPVTLVMEQPKGIEVLPGMAGKVTGKVDKEDNSNTLTVSSSALLTEGPDQQTFVWVIDSNNQVHKQLIKIGELTPTGVSVLQGLKPNDWVVIAGIHSLNEGETVTILNQEGK